MLKASRINKITVFCGSSTGNLPVYAEAAVKLAQVLSDADITLVYGGASVGIMKIIADQMLKNDGKVIGVIPQSLVDVEIAHEGLTDLHIVNSMHERKALMETLSDGFIMLPGGFGSLDEFFEILTWAQLGRHTKPCGILNVKGYFDQLLTFLDSTVEKGFISDSLRAMILVDTSPAALLQKFNNYEAQMLMKWVTSERMATLP